MSECSLYLAVSEKHVQIVGATSESFYLGLRVAYTVPCHIYVSVPQLSVYVRATCDCTSMN